MYSRRAGVPSAGNCHVSWFCCSSLKESLLCVWQRWSNWGWLQKVFKIPPKYLEKPNCYKIKGKVFTYISNSWKDGKQKVGTNVQFSQCRIFTWQIPPRSAWRPMLFKVISLGNRVEREVATFADGIKLCRAVKEKTFCNEERCCDMEW